MRILLLPLCLLIAACASAHFATSLDPSRAMASLVVNKDKPDPFGYGHGQIWSVDNRFLPNGTVESIFLLPGRRTIGYTCPGTLYLDAAIPPTVTFVFEPNKSYEIDIDCATETRIKLVVKER
jgi:hypothetical protein